MIRSNASPHATGIAGEDIAIVGMACMLPGADTPGQFWENIVHKVDSITEAPPDWQEELFYDPAGPKIDKTYTKRGGFIGDLCRFNPMKYGTVPNTVEGAEPDQFIALRCAYEALADAGVPQLPLNREKTGVIMGRGIFVNRGWVTVFQKTFAVDQTISVLRRLEPHRSEAELDIIRRELKRNLPPANADTFPGLVHSALVGRIANRLDLMGPTYTVDCACSSSLIAVQHAIDELRTGRCDCVMAGGTQVSIPAPIHIMFCHIEAVSKTGRIAPFSADAAGTMLGQGCGLVVLKRRSDAERDGNRIYALIKTIASSSDGKGAGLLAPRSEGQQLAIRRAYEQSGWTPEMMELIEAHGTGIPLGDATEIGSLVKCFGPRKGSRPTVALGSVKSNIGHLVPASGTAALIKTSLALYHRVLPPTLHAEVEQPELKLSETPFFLCNEPRPWLHGERDYPRRAGINAFGFGGINAHALLEEYPAADETKLARLNTKWPVELVVVSATNREALRRRVEHIAAWVGRSKELRLLDIAASCAKETGEARVAIVAKSVEDLTKKLLHVGKLLGESGRDRIQDRNGIYWQEKPLAREGRVAFIMPGEGSQYPNMLEDVCRHFPEVRRQFELTDMAFKLRNGQSLSHVMFPQPRDIELAERELFKMDIAVAVVTAAARGLLELLKTLNVRPSAVMGHSSGEFAAILASGAYKPASEDDLIKSIVDGTNSTGHVASSDLVGKAVLIAVGGAEPQAVEEAVAACQGKIEIAIDNCPHQVVLVGDDQSAAKALEILKGKGGLCQIIPWDRAYHTEAFAPVCRFVEEYFATVKIGAPDIELWSCATAQPFPRDPAGIRELAVRQWKSKVRFRETVQNMYEAGIRVFVEVGPRGNLSAFVADTLAGKPHAAIALNTQQKSGLEQVCRAAGMLAAQGVPVHLDALFERRRPKLMDLNAEPPAPAVREPKLKLELPLLLIDDNVAEAWRNSAPTPASTATSSVVETPGAPPSTRDRAFADFQRTMQTFLQTQESVMRAKASGRPPLLPTAPAAPKSVAPTPVPPVAQKAASQPIAAAVVADRKLPFIDVLLEHEPGSRLVAECEIDLARHRFLLDHTFFGRNLSKQDPTLTALPIVPLALTLELMAEAAVKLFPEFTAFAASDIVVSRWLAMETPTRRVRMVAQAESVTAVRVTVLEADKEGMQGEIAAATIELAPETPDLGAPRFRASATLPPPWPPQDLYGKVLYHGPTFQGIDEVEKWGADNVLCRVHEPDIAHIFPGGRHDDLVFPVQLIDTASQIPGLVNGNWAAEGPTCTLAFPNHIQRLEVSAHRSSNPRMSAVSTLVQDDKKMTSETEIVDADGRVVLRYLGKVEEVVRFPLGLYQAAAQPTKIFCSRDLADGFRHVPGIDRVTVRAVDRAGDKLLVNRFWAQILALLMLDRKERETFFNTRAKMPPVALAGWLLGRVVAKDTVRVSAKVEVSMADVGIRHDAGGRPFVDAAGFAAPLVSMAHRNFNAVAAATSAFAGIGIDIEPVGLLNPTLIEEAFDPAERNLLAAAGRPAEELYPAAWCAKEAIGKALGRGVLGGPRSVRIVSCDAGMGAFGCELAGTMADAFPNRAKGLVAWWMVHDGIVHSLCLLKPA